MKTTIQISDELRKQLKILASRRDVSYEQLIQDMVDVFQELNREKSILSIPAALGEKVKRLSKNSGFSKSSEFITYVLREAVGFAKENKNEYTKKEEAAVKNRLKSLGYVD